MPRPSLQLLFALAVILAASYYWEPRTGPAADAATTARRQQLPQTYLDKTRSWAYDESGNLANIIEANRAEHFADRNETLMQEPRFYAHNADNKTYSATATTGRFIHKSEVLYLVEAVTLLHDQSGGRLDTRAMAINLKTRVAATILPVTLTQGQNRTDARGMSANLETEEIILKPEVESIYVLPKS